jgi:cobalt-zinc-cadmium efflux system membrane fusion protein
VAICGFPWSNTPEEVTASDSSKEEEADGVITLAKTKWNTAGIRIEQAHRQTLQPTISLTGKLALNEDRLAQVFPQVEGIVEQVPVRFGQDVTAGQTLAVINSQHIGAAKLELIRNRLATQLAEVNFRWHQAVEANVQELVASLKQQVPLSEIEQSFVDRDMGDYRAQLVSAYARLHKSQADYERIEELAKQRVTAGKELLAVRAALEADQATMQALLEQIRFTSQQNRIAAAQELEKARTAESVSEMNLRILGVTDTAQLAAAVAARDETVSHYTIAAPFAGTIIAKDVVLEERVDPTAQLFTIADLSTVWVRVDVFEQHVPLLAGLATKTIRFRATSYPDRVFKATVFSTGSVIDQTTRTAPMTAVAENSQRLLKPGMFVEVELQAAELPDVLVVPTDAIQQHENKRFVFIHVEGDEFVRRDVTTGRASGDMIEIMSGLNEGDKIVVQGGFFLKSQMLAEQFADED